MKNRNKLTKKESIGTELLQLENFIIRKRGDGVHSYIVVSAVGGAWRMEFRDDTFKYAWILMLASEEKYHQILLSWIVLSYHVTGCAPDPDFIEGVISELHKLNERSVERKIEAESKAGVENKS